MDYRTEIKQYMKENKISYAALADTMGISRQRVWYMVNGKKGVNVATLEKLCRALGISISLT